MKKNDVICPECNEIMGFRNFMVIDDETTVLKGIVYLLTCVKCDTTFIPPMRMSKKATKKQMAEMRKSLKQLEGKK